MDHNTHKSEAIIILKAVHLPEVEVGQAILRIHQQIAGVGVGVKKPDLEELPRGALDACVGINR